MKKILKKVFGWLRKMSAKTSGWISEKVDAKDVVIGGGLLMTGAGCWLIYPPAALIVVGGTLFGLGTGMIKIK